MLQVPLNRIGYGTFNAAQFKTIQEILGLLSFVIFSALYLKEPIGWNIVAGFCFIAFGRFCIFHKWHIGRAISQSWKLDRACPRLGPPWLARPISSDYHRSKYGKAKLMNLEGSVVCAAPVKLARALADPEVLAKIAPQGCVIGTKAGDTVPFKIVRHFGPLHVTMSCTLTLQKKSDAPGFDLLIKGSHLIGGKVTINLDLLPLLPQSGPRKLQWRGTMETSGLAHRLAQERSVRARALVKDLLLRVRQVLEGNPDATAGTPSSPD